MVMQRFNVLIIISLVLWLQNISVSAQKKVKVVAQYSYTTSDRVSPQVAEIETIHRAQIQAIEETFGSVVSESSKIILKTGSEEREDYFSLSECDVRGFWLESTSDTIWSVPKYDHKQKTVTYTVRLEGKICEYESSPIDVQYGLLYNGTDIIKNKLRNNSFLEGDQLYIWIKAPVDGYLAIYNVDYSADKIVQRLYPYEGYQINSFQLKADSTYVLFSPDHAPSAIKKQNVTELLLGANSSHDYNQFYIIFSPKDFHKCSEIVPVKNSKDEELPPYVEFSNFQKWLTGIRNHDKDMFVKKEFVDIIKQ